jgi:RNA polymerase sigma factor (TIGR02999 family)
MQDSLSHPSDPALSDLARAIDALGRGEPGAMDEVFRLAYGDLRDIARSRLRKWRPSETLNTTALVHEAYLRSRGRTQSPGWVSARHFFAFSAKAMRHILVDHARRKQSAARGGGMVQLTLDEAGASGSTAGPADRLDLLALDTALRKLGAFDPRLERLVELRYFAGCSLPEVARELDVSQRTAERDWTRARSWLRVLLDEEGTEIPTSAETSDG